MAQTLTSVGRAVHCEQSSAQWCLLSNWRTGTEERKDGQVRRRNQASMEHSVASSFLFLKMWCKEFLFCTLFAMNKRCRHLEWISGTAFTGIACNMFIFSCIPVWLLEVFLFRFSNVLNLKESSTLLLSETRLHGKQDKPEGSRHVKSEKETENKQTEKSLTNSGYTGFLWNFLSFFSKFEKVLAWQKNFGTHTPKNPER